MLEIFSYHPRHDTDLVNLILPIQTKEFGIVITAEDQPDLLNIPAHYFQGQGHFWVAEDAQQVVGSIGLLDIGDGRGVIRKMFVRKDYRGRDRGVAASLLQRLITWCTEKRFNEILLGTTDKYFAAHRFYEKNAFTRISRSDLPPSFPVMKVDSIFYRRTIEGQG